MNYTKLRKALGFFSMKALAVVLSSALVVPMTAPLAQAASLELAQGKYFSSLAMSNIKQGGTAAGTGNGTATSTTTVILNLSYSGSAASANVTIGSSCITFYAPQGTIDTGIGSATCGFSGGTFDISVSSFDSLGELCDAINGVVGPFALSGNANGGAPTGGNYHCTLVGGVRSDAALNYLPAVTQAANVNNLNAIGGYQVPTSTAALISVGIIPSAGRHVVLNYCTANSAGTPSVQVYGVPARDGVGASGLSLFGATLTDTNLAWVSPPLVANTTTNLPVATVNGNSWIEFSGGGTYSYALNIPAGHAPNPPVGTAYNGHVVVRANNYGLGATLQSTTNFLSCNWLERWN